MATLSESEKYQVQSLASCVSITDHYIQLQFAKNVATVRPPPPYLCVSHTGGGNEGLLDGVALGEGGLLLALRGLLLAHAPVTLDEELHHLYVASEGSVNQGALAVLVQLVHLLAGHHLIRNTPSLTAHPWLHTR